MSWELPYRRYNSQSGSDADIGNAVFSGTVTSVGSVTGDTGPVFGGATDIYLNTGSITYTANTLTFNKAGTYLLDIFFPLIFIGQSSDTCRFDNTGTATVPLLPTKVRSTVIAGGEEEGSYNLQWIVTATQGQTVVFSMSSASDDFEVQDDAIITAKRVA